MTSLFAPGDLVYARGREWVTLPSPNDDTFIYGLSPVRRLMCR
jgi:hypothetical protein